jgi:hypothetical protein
MKIKKYVSSVALALVMLSGLCVNQQDHSVKTSPVEPPIFFIYFVHGTGD